MEPNATCRRLRIAGPSGAASGLGGRPARGHLRARSTCGSSSRHECLIHPPLLAAVVGRQISVRQSITCFPLGPYVGNVCPMDFLERLRTHLLRVLEKKAEPSARFVPDDPWIQRRVLENRSRAIRTDFGYCGCNPRAAGSSHSPPRFPSGAAAASGPSTPRGPRPHQRPAKCRARGRRPLPAPGRSSSRGRWSAAPNLGR